MNNEIKPSLNSSALSIPNVKTAAISNNVSPTPVISAAENVVKLIPWVKLKTSPECNLRFSTSQLTRYSLPYQNCTSPGQIRSKNLSALSSDPKLHETICDSKHNNDMMTLRNIAYLYYLLPFSAKPGKVDQQSGICHPGHEAVHFCTQGGWSDTFYEDICNEIVHFVNSQIASHVNPDDVHLPWITSTLLSRLGIPSEKLLCLCREGVKLGKLDIKNLNVFFGDFQLSILHHLKLYNEANGCDSLPHTLNLIDGLKEDTMRRHLTTLISSITLRADGLPLSPEKFTENFCESYVSHLELSQNLLILQKEGLEAIRSKTVVIVEATAKVEMQILCILTLLECLIAPENELQAVHFLNNRDYVPFLPILVNKLCLTLMANTKLVANKSISSSEIQDNVTKGINETLNSLMISLRDTKEIGVNNILENVFTFYDLYQQHVFQFLNLMNFEVKSALKNNKNDFIPLRILVKEWSPTVEDLLSTFSKKKWLLVRWLNQLLTVTQTAQSKKNKSIQTGTEVVEIDSQQFSLGLKANTDLIIKTMLTSDPLVHIQEFVDKSLDILSRSKEEMSQFPFDDVKTLSKDIVQKLYDLFAEKPSIILNFEYKYLWHSIEENFLFDLRLALYSTDHESIAKHSSLVINHLKTIEQGHFLIHHSKVMEVIDSHKSDLASVEKEFGKENEKLITLKKEIESTTNILSSINTKIRKLPKSAVKEKEKLNTQQKELQSKLTKAIPETSSLETQLILLNFARLNLTLKEIKSFLIKCETHPSLFPQIKEEEISSNSLRTNLITIYKSLEGYLDLKSDNSITTFIYDDTVKGNMHKATQKTVETCKEIAAILRSLDRYLINERPAADKLLKLYSELNFKAQYSSIAKTSSMRKLQSLLDFPSLLIFSNYLLVQLCKGPFANEKLNPLLISINDHLASKSNPKHLDKEFHIDHSKMIVQLENVFLFLEKFLQNRAYLSILETHTKKEEIFLRVQALIQLFDILHACQEAIGNYIKISSTLMVKLNSNSEIPAFDDELKRLNLQTQMLLGIQTQISSERQLLSSLLLQIEDNSPKYLTSKLALLSLSNDFEIQDRLAKDISTVQEDIEQSLVPLLFEQHLRNKDAIPNLCDIALEAINFCSTTMTHTQASAQLFKGWIEKQVEAKNTKKAFDYPTLLQTNITRFYTILNYDYPAAILIYKALVKKWISFLDEEIVSPTENKRNFILSNHLLQHLKSIPTGLHQGLAILKKWDSIDSICKIIGLSKVQQFVQQIVHEFVKDGITEDNVRSLLALETQEALMGDSKKIISKDNPEPWHLLDSANSELRNRISLFTDHLHQYFNTMPDEPLHSYELAEKFISFFIEKSGKQGEHLIATLFHKLNFEILKPLSQEGYNSIPYVIHIFELLQKFDPSKLDDSRFKPLKHEDLQIAVQEFLDLKKIKFSLKDIASSLAIRLYLISHLIHPPKDKIIFERVYLPNLFRGFILTFFQQSLFESMENQQRLLAEKCVVIDCQDHPFSRQLSTHHIEDAQSSFYHMQLTTSEKTSLIPPKKNVRWRDPLLAFQKDHKWILTDSSSQQIAFLNKSFHLKIVKYIHPHLLDDEQAHKKEITLIEKCLPAIKQAITYTLSKIHVKNPQNPIFNATKIKAELSLASLKPND